MALRSLQSTVVGSPSNKPLIFSPERCPVHNYLSRKRVARVET